MKFILRFIGISLLWLCFPAFSTPPTGDSEKFLTYLCEVCQRPKAESYYYNGDYRQGLRINRALSSPSTKALPATVRYLKTQTYRYYDKALRKSKLLNARGFFKPDRKTQDALLQGLWEGVHKQEITQEQVKELVVSSLYLNDFLHTIRSPKSARQLVIRGDGVCIGTSILRLFTETVEMGDARSAQNVLKWIAEIQIFKNKNSDRKTTDVGRQLFSSAKDAKGEKTVGSEVVHEYEQLLTVMAKKSEGHSDTLLEINELRENFCKLQERYNENIQREEM